MGDYPAFLGVPLTSQTWLNHAMEMKPHAVPLIEDGSKFYFTLMENQTKVSRQYAHECSLIGPFNSQQDAEAWLAWATVQLS